MINCEIHDFIEIACLYKIEVLLVLISGEEITGVASTTNIDAQKQECIVIECAGEPVPVVLDIIKTMTAVTANPHFTKVNIS